MKRLSIIIPVYNVEPYVGQCLQSILEKGGAGVEDFEVIVVNDGSPDGSMRVVRNICSGRENVVILEQDNQGLSAARMNGLQLACGEYVWFVDSDDWIEENGVAAVIDLITKDSSTQVFLLPLFWDFEEPSRNFSDINTRPGQIAGKRIIQEGSYPLSAAQRFIIRKELFGSKWVYFPAGLLHEDEYFGRALLYQAERVCVIPETWYHYRQRSGSIMSHLTPRSAYDIIQLYHLLLDFQNECVNASDKVWFRENCYRLLEYSYIQLAISPNSEAYHTFKRKYLSFILSEHCAARYHLTIKQRLNERLRLRYPRIAAHFRNHFEDS